MKPSIGLNCCTHPSTYPARASNRCARTARVGEAAGINCEIVKESRLGCGYILNNFQLSTFNFQLGAQVKIIRYIDANNNIRYAAEQPDGRALVIDGDIFGAHHVTDTVADVRKRLAPIAPTS